MDDVNKNEAIKFILDEENTSIVDFTLFIKIDFMMHSNNIHHFTNIFKFNIYIIWYIRVVEIQI